MNVQNICMLLAVAFSLGAYATVPRITVTGLAQDAATRRVTATYRLHDAPAVVTVSFLTNDAPVDASDCAYVGGDANRLVTDLDADLSINWTPRPGLFGDAARLSVRISAWTVDAPPDYMDIGLSVSNCVRYYVSADAVPGGVTNIAYKTDRLLMRKIPARNVVWTMGSPGDEPGRNAESAYLEIQHKVKLTSDYYMAIYPTTQRQSRLLGRSGVSFGANESDFSQPGYHGNPDFKPMDKISLNKLRGYANASWPGWPSLGHEVKPDTTIALARSLTGVELDLPTEAQWEYACRAGAATPFNNGATALNSKDVLDVCWFGSNSTTNAPDGTTAAQPHEVGLKEPNAWGLYDVHGNLYEWCLDRVVDNVKRYNEPGKVYVDPVGTNDVNVIKFVIRGGNYNRGNAGQCRSAYATSTWADYKGYVGYRLCCPAIAK